MKNSRFKVEFYDKANGIKPAKDFITGLPPKMRAKILRVISILEVNGSELREPYSKHLDEGIFELRGAGRFRYIPCPILLCYWTESHFDSWFCKKTKKTPISEIERAKNYRKEYLERKENKK